MENFVLEGSSAHPVCADEHQGFPPEGRQLDHLLVKTQLGPVKLSVQPRLVQFLFLLLGREGSTEADARGIVRLFVHKGLSALLQFEGGNELGGTGTFR